MMVPNPLVTIITVCLNAEATIGRTIESVLNQDHRNLEYFIIDGGSTDGTPGIIMEYEPKFQGRMRWVSEPDKGIYDAMNKGIGLAKGSLIGIINADDWYEKDAVGQAVSVLDDKGEGVITGRLCLCDRNGKKLYYKDPAKDIARKAVKGMPINHPATFVSKSVYDGIGLFDVSLKTAADYDFVLRAIKSGVRFYTTEADMAFMRLGGISSVGLGRDLSRAGEHLQIRRRYGYGPVVFVYFFHDVMMAIYRRLKRRLFGRLFVLKRIDLESGVHSSRPEKSG